MLNHMYVEMKAIWIYTFEYKNFNYHQLQNYMKKITLFLQLILPIFGG